MKKRCRCVEMKLEDWMVIAGLLILAIGIIVPWPRNTDFSTTVVGVVLIVIRLVAGSETLKKRKPERSKKDAEKE